MPKSIYEVEIGGELFEVEADSPEQAATAAKQHPLWKATQGMPEQSRLADMKPYKPGLADKGVQFMEGVGQGVVDIAKGVAGIPAAVYSDPVGFVKNIPASVIEGTKETIGDALSLDPKRMGEATVDLATFVAPVAKPVTKAALRPVGKLAKSGVAEKLLKNQNQGGFFTMLNNMRGMIGGTLDPPRLVRGYERNMPNVPASSTATAPAMEVMEPVAARVDPYMRNIPATSVAADPSAAAAPLPNLVDRFVANTSGAQAGRGPQAQRFSRTSAGVHPVPPRVPGQLDAETAAFVQEYQQRAAQGVGGFRGEARRGGPVTEVPTVPRQGVASNREFVEFWTKQLRQRFPRASQAEIQTKLDAIMRRGSH